MFPDETVSRRQGSVMGSGSECIADNFSCCKQTVQDMPLISQNCQEKAVVSQVTHLLDGWSVIRKVSAFYQNPKNSYQTLPLTLRWVVNAQVSRRE